MTRELTNLGGMAWTIRRLQAGIRDLRVALRQFRDDTACTREALTHRSDRLIDSHSDVFLRRGLLKCYSLSKVYFQQPAPSLGAPEKVLGETQR